MNWVRRHTLRPPINWNRKPVPPRVSDWFRLMIRMIDVMYVMEGRT